MKDTLDTTSELREAVARIIGTAILKNDKNYTNDMMELIESHTNKAINLARANDPHKCEHGHEVYSHKTADGWCCACEADIAFLKAQQEEV